MEEEGKVNYSSRVRASFSVHATVVLRLSVTYSHRLLRFIPSELGTAGWEF